MLKPEELGAWIKGVEGAVLIVDKVGARLSEKAKRQFKEIQLRTKKVYTDYLVGCIKKYRATKTILYSDTPVPLLSFYEPLDVRHRSTIYPSVDFEAMQSIGRHIMLMGTAGAGKSTLAKYLLLDAIKKEQRVPVLVELRDLNESDDNVSNLILETLRVRNEDFTHEHLETTLSWGHYMVILDGFDEVQESIRSTIQRQILRLASRYADNLWIVTSRQDRELAYWEMFTNVQTCPLNKAKSIAMIEKLKVDSSIRGRFVAELNDGLYERIESFASNPLLLTITLMTYADNADIPLKRHLLYDQIFLTLFQRHDATKGFRRKMFCGLARDDFERVLEAFSIKTLLSQSLTFTESQLHSYLDEASQISLIQFDQDRMKQDLLESVCFLTAEGHSFTFTHRSFQEYFAARYIQKCGETRQATVLEHVAGHFRDRQLLLLLFEMDRDTVEQLVMAPELKRIRESIGLLGTAQPTSVEDLYAYAVPNFKMEGQHISALPLNFRALNFIEFLREVYPDHYTAKEAPHNPDPLASLIREAGGTLDLRRDTGRDPKVRIALEQYGLLTMADIDLMLKAGDEIRQRRQSSRNIDHILGLSRL